MYSRIMVPVDLAHADKLQRAFEIAAMIAKQEGATLIYTGVGAETPGAVAHTPKEFADKLQKFAETQRTAHGMPVEAHAAMSHDPAVDLNETLVAAAKKVDADLIVMASHIPGLADHWFHGHAAYVAQNAPISVFVVR